MCGAHHHADNAGVWDCIFAVRPQLVGGCRPQNLLMYLGPEWHNVHAQIVPGGVIRSQVIVAYKAHDTRLNQ